MEPEAPTGGHRRGPRRWWRRLVLLAVILPPATLGLINLALGSPWTREWLARKIHARTTLEASIDGVTWTPWSALTIRGITLHQPAPLKALVDEPLVHIERLRMRPVWKTILTGEPDLREISLTSPRVVLPLEMLSHLASSTQPPVAMTSPAAEAPLPPPHHPQAPDAMLAGATPADHPPVTPSLNSPSSPATPAEHPASSPTVAETPPPSPSEAVTPGKPSPLTPPTQDSPTGTPGKSGKPELDEKSKTSSAPQPDPSSPPPHSPPSLPTAPALISFPTDFIHLENASIAIVLAGMKVTLLETSGVNGKIPVAGDPGHSTLTIGSLQTFGNKVMEDRTLHLDWKSPAITMVPFEETTAGLKTRFSVQMAMVPGVPFALHADTPEQPLPPLSLPGEATLEAPSAAAALRFRGQLIFPSTWLAEFASKADKPTSTLHGQKTEFDHARCAAVLRGGSFSCPDARIVGEHLSLLGNATVLSNGSTAGVLRVVAPPETTASIVKQFFPGLQAPPAFSAMSTPQRVALDIEASGSLGDIQIRLGKNGPLIGAPKPPSSATPP